LEDALQFGADAFPGVSVDPKAFARFLAPLTPSPVCLPEVYLAFACTAHDPRALRYFDDRFLSRVPLAVAPIDGSPAFADEVAQTLRTRMLVGPPPQLATYQGRGSLTGWVLVAATRLAIDLVRERRKWAGPTRAEYDVLESLVAPQDTEREVLRARHGEALRDAIRAAFDSISSRERAVLKFHVLDGASIDTIAGVYSIHRATAARWIQGVNATLRERTLARLASALALGASEANSLMRTLFCEADVSLRRHLAP
ncbi:MAG: transcriptional regulator, partial [Myxococcaceae bacterium]|nr:transcriptional regulator [Myxococcaceae bacterium]